MTKRKTNRDPVAYRLRYALITQRLHARSGPWTDHGDSHDRVPRRPDAVQAAIDVARHRVGARSKREGDPVVEARELVEMATQELRRLGWKWVGSRPRWYARRLRLRNSTEDRHLGEFLDGALEPAAVIVYWSAVVERDGWQALDFLLSTYHREGRLARLRSLLTWHQVRDGGRWLNRGRIARRRGGVNAAWLQRYLRVLRETDPKLRDHGRGLHAGLGLMRVPPLSGPNYRVRYNLACLFCRLANLRLEGEAGFVDELFDEAIAQLSLCLEGARGRQREEIVSWAERDPSLMPLREARHDRFESIVLPYRPPTRPGPSES